MTAILAALTFGSVAFWLVIAAIVIADAIALEFESGWAASAVTVIGVLALTYANQVSLPRLLIDNPIPVLLSVIAWFIIGTTWGIVKWWFWLHRKRESYEANGWKPGDRTWDIPQAKYHKALILMWMTYWPVSALWTLINDPVRKAWRWVFGRVARHLQQMSDRVFA